MASIATCPQCARQLAVPESAASTDHAECPLCEATFLLANVVRLSVPPARIIGLSTAAEELASPTLNTPTFDELQTKTAPAETVPESTTDSPSIDALPSWEARLKRAIESETTEMASVTDQEAPKPQPEPITPTSFDQPEFDFQLDTPPQAETLTPAPVEPPSAAVAATENPSSTPKETFETDLGAPELPTRRTDTSAPDAHAALMTNLHQNSKQRTQRRSWVKIAAATLTTGFLGTVLGLYALLWLRGPSADFFGLANYLPAALLPATETPPPASALAESSTPPPAIPPQEEPAAIVADPTQLADTQPMADAPPLEEVPPVSQPLALEPLASTPATPNPLHHDAAVQPAITEQPLEQPPAVHPAVASISADQFSQLVVAAKAAQSRFLEGDLISQESIAAKGRAYMTLCQLAEHFDFTHQFGLAPTAQAEVETATEIYNQLFTNTEAQGDLAKITSSWWGHDKRSNQGIFLTGVVQDARPLGTKTLCNIQPGGQNTLQPIPVLVDRSTVAVGSRIGVLGHIATQQDGQLASLGINLPRLVVSLYSDELP